MAYTFRSLFALGVVLSILATSPALAQMYSAGSPCPEPTPGRVFTQEGAAGPALVCNGTTLEVYESIKTGPMRKGVGTANPAATLDVAGEAKIGNTSLACSATTEGAMRYNSTSKEMEYCNGTAWTSLSPAAGGGITVHFTTTTYDGNLGGFVGANAKCQSEFPGSYFCPHDDFLRSGTTTSTSAWVDSPGGYYTGGTNIYGRHSCNGWVHSLSTSFGTRTTGGTTNCNASTSLACCSR